MPSKRISRAAYADTKPHYNVLNGLRGVAAIVVVCFHIFEAFATSHLDQRINHGYLAVDFFFILSGFVIGYAYDDRWKTMSKRNFFLRRIIRLHPMVVMGALIGALLFYTQGCEFWDVSQITIIALLGATILNALLLPATPSMEVRGVGEMFPLNGPSWSLFFEYIANILYAFILCKLSTRILAIVVAITAIGLATYSIAGSLGDICVGFSLTGIEFTGGSLRLLFSFSAGLLLSRIFKPIKINGAFWICGAILVVLLAVPRLGGAEHLWMNGIYDFVCCAIFFPLLVFLGASEKKIKKHTEKVCKFLGDISYPLYMVHYPFIYLYFAWVKNNELTFEDSIWGAVGVMVASLVLAYICLKFYDIPVRRYLTNRFLKKNKEQSSNKA